MKKSKGISYSEPGDYFPKSVRKKFGLGEFAKDSNTSDTKKKTTKKTVKKSK